jgi:copper chaperone
MHCSHCASAVEKALLAVEGVASVKVSLDDKTAIVKPMCGTMPDIAKLKAAVESAGYKVTGECRALL